MHPRYLASLPMVVATIAIGLLMGVPLTAQTGATDKPAGAGKGWIPPRTPWGDPALEGIWLNNTSTPLERPKKVGAKAELTPEEVAAADRQAVAHRNEADRRDYRPGTVTDVGRAYNAFWMPAPGRPTNRTSLVVDPADGRVPALTPEARTRFAAWAAALGLFNSSANPEGSLWNGGAGAGPIGRVFDDGEGPVDGTDGGVDGRGTRADNPEDRKLSERCILWSPLPRLPNAYNNNVRIVQGPGYVVLEMEMMHDARIIPLDGRPHLPASVRRWFGDSRGHWEGMTLVIDTTNFTDKAPFKGSFDRLHLVERLTRVDPQTIDYQVTLEDPTTWIAPWTMEWPLMALSAEADRDAQGHGLVTVPAMFEYACHEGNYGLMGQLRGARALEAATTAKK